MSQKNSLYGGLHLSRRNFLRGLLGGALILGGGSYLAKETLYSTAANSLQFLPENLKPRFLRQIITTDSATSRMLMWQVDSQLSEPHIEYRIKGQSESVNVTAQEDYFTDDGVYILQYHAKLENLLPNTTYKYRLVSKNNVSDWYIFNTAGHDNFKCLIFPDSQSSDYSDWENMAQFAAKQNPDASFFINMGDLVDNGEDHSQWRAWFNGVKGIIDRIPFVPVMGNHETYDKNWQVRLPEAYLHYFAVPDNNSKSFSRYYYEFDYGNAHFMVLNSQWEETAPFKSGLIEEQQRWLRESVRQSNKRWNIVLVHKDVLQYQIRNHPERKEGFSDVGEAFMPRFDELGIDVVFTAHLHTYRNRGHIRNFRHDSQGPLYILTGVAGNVRYTDFWIDHALDKKIAPQPETDNYLTMELSKNQLLVKCFLPNGEEIDRVILEKA